MTRPSTMAPAHIPDEILSEIREEVLTEAALAKTKIMVDVMQEHCPDVKVSAEPAACRRWFKSAAPVWKDGKLRPWWPKTWDWAPDQEQMQKDLQ